MNLSVRGTITAALITGLLAVPGSSSAAQVRYEAEQATIVNGTVANNHPGFTGTGFVDSTNAIGSAIEFTVIPTEGTAVLAFRSANGTSADRPATLTVDDVIPGLAPNLVAFYDFEHPSSATAAVELDQGPSGTNLNLINGGAVSTASRASRSWPGSR